jgi:2-polyprenyl-3-methyl-5-hydroxy-6-metoxy-1,4-benzoquinol methylase
VVDAAARVSQRVRRKKWRLYQQVFPPRPGERVLDVGVSQYADAANENYFLHAYPAPEQVTAVGVDDLSGLQDDYPGVTFLQADGRQLPFADEQFDVVHSNAVIEHVGPLEEQRRFAAELMRVGKAGFVTTPNKWFPFDTHTRRPFLHWFRQDEGVWLLTRRQMQQLFPHGDVRVQRIIGWPVTITVIF